MSEFNNPMEPIAIFSAQLTEERLAEARSKSGIGYLPPGALTELVKDQPFSVEDIVTALQSGLVLQTEDNKMKAARVSELEDLCNCQQSSIDGLADQVMRLRALLATALPDMNSVSPLEMLKDIASRADSNGSAKP